MMVSQLVLTRYDDLSTPTLARMLNFTAHDLRANRAGSITHRQRRRLRRWRSLERPRHLRSTALLMLLVLFMVHISMLLQVLGKVETALHIVIGTSSLTLIFEALISYKKTLPHRVHVTSITGHVYPRQMVLPDPQHPYHTSKTFYFISVNDVLFEVQPHLLRAFHPSRRYRLYFVEETYTLLSVELVT